jgi:DNA-binding transcriptional regulator YbjK
MSKLESIRLQMDATRREIASELQKITGCELAFYANRMKQLEVAYEKAYPKPECDRLVGW